MFLIALSTLSPIPDVSLDSRVHRELAPKRTAQSTDLPSHRVMTMRTQLPPVVYLVEPCDDPTMERVTPQVIVYVATRLLEQFVPCPVAMVSEVLAAALDMVLCGPLDSDPGLGLAESLLHLETEQEVCGAELLWGAVRSRRPCEKSGRPELCTHVERARQEVDLSCQTDSVDGFDGVGIVEHDTRVQELSVEAMLVPGIEVHRKDGAEAAHAFDDEALHPVPVANA